MIRHLALLVLWQAAEDLWDKDSHLRRRAWAFYQGEHLAIWCEAAELSTSQVRAQAAYSRDHRSAIMENSQREGRRKGGHNSRRRPLLKRHVTS